MTDQTPKPVDLVPVNSVDEALNQQKEGFLQRALNRTKEAFRNVDEAITGRETFRNIEQRLQRQDEINESYKARLEEALTQVAIWKEEFEQELSDFSTRTKQQKAFFEENNINPHKNGFAVDLGSGHGILLHPLTSVI